MRRPAARWAVILAAAGATTAPAARSTDEILRDMNAAKRQLATAIGSPRELADPARRPAVLGRAGPPLRQLIAGDRELAAANGRVAPGPTLLEVQLQAMLSAMDDPAATADLARLAADPREQTALRGRGGQLVARWLQVPGQTAAEGKVVDDLAALDAAHPESDDLATFTGLMTGSSATPQVRARVRRLLDPMTSRTAEKLRARLPTTGPATRP